MNDADVDVFLSLVERHTNYLHNLALRMTGDEEDAKDVVQESLLNAYLHLDQFERRADVRSWLHRIVVNCALDHLRRRRRRPMVLPAALALGAAFLACAVRVRYTGTCLARVESGAPGSWPRSRPWA